MTSPLYILTPAGLTIPDPESFGLEGGEMYGQPHFTVALNEFDHPRRTYNVFRMVLQHTESGRCFETEYSIHEAGGFEWGPGMGRDAVPDWTEVYPETVTTTAYVRVKP